ncbi:hypothetical protein FKW77_001455 [Venturia effusa]|uniref:Uncharacterized protein n=1 Tax=Venturia effusa TaxID=50376 RepID=A0A517L2R3_9PEZI|nr:hypothetical protein FKW77_001455 [Venturia effusa]
MATPQRRTKRRNNQAQPQAQNQPHRQQEYYQKGTDYEADYQDRQPPSMNNIVDDVNKSVLRRYWPDIKTILTIAPFVELYVFIPEMQKWEKTGKGGTVFVCELTSSDPGIQRFSVVMLNRRGLDNFATEIKSTQDVEITDELMINVMGGDEGDNSIYGLWIHAEPETSTARARELTVQKIMEVAESAERSRKSVLDRMAEEERLTERMQDDDVEELEAENGYDTGTSNAKNEQSGAPMGRQLSLSHLFDRQKAQDSGLNVDNHQSSGQPLTYPSEHRIQVTQTTQNREQHNLEGQQSLTPPTTTAQVPAPQFRIHPDTDFFRSGPDFTPPIQEQGGRGAGHGVSVNGGNALLEDMFRRQRAGQ